MKARYRFLILFIIVGIVVAVLANMGFFESQDVPEKIKDRIMELETDDYEIDSIRDNGKVYSVRLNMMTQATSVKIEGWVHILALRVHDILVDEDVNRDIMIEARKKLTGGMVVDYGTGYYSPVTVGVDSFEFILPD